MVRILGISGSLRAQSEAIRKQLAEFVQGFVVFVARSMRESRS